MLTLVKIIIFVVIIAILAIVILAIKSPETLKKILKTLFDKQNNIKTAESHTFYLKNKVLSDAEYSFMNVLKTIMPDMDIYPNIRMIDVVTAKEHSDRMKVRQKHIDFMICQLNEPILAIELDDSSHDKRHTQDKAKNDIFDKANLPYLRIKCQRTYDTQKLSNLIKHKLYGDQQN